MNRDKDGKDNAPVREGLCGSRVDTNAVQGRQQERRFEQGGQRGNSSGPGRHAATKVAEQTSLPRAFSSEEAGAGRPVAGEDSKVPDLPDSELRHIQSGGPVGLRDNTAGFTGGQNYK